MSSLLTRNYFELFALPERYRLDRAALDASYRRLQREVHPDRFAGGTDRERRLSVQQAARINEAYATLREPLGRGRYLLELRGVATGDPEGSHQDPEFLMQQIELREALGEVRAQTDPPLALERLLQSINAQYQALESDLAVALDDTGELQTAQKLVLQMQYFKRLRTEVQELEDDLY